MPRTPVAFPNAALRIVSNVLKVLKVLKFLIIPDLHESEAAPAFGDTIDAGLRAAVVVPEALLVFQTSASVTDS